MTPLYPILQPCGAVHLRAGWAVQDDFGNLVKVELQKVIDYDYSNSHDKFQLRSFQLPSYYRLSRGLGNSNGRGLPADAN